MMSRKYYNTSKKGFSLIEVCLAMVVMAIGLTAVFALFPSSLELGAKAKHANKVGVFASELHDIIRYEVNRSSDFTVLTRPYSVINDQLAIIHTDPLDLPYNFLIRPNVGSGGGGSLAGRVNEREYTLRIYHNPRSNTGTFDEFYSIVAHD